MPSVQEYVLVSQDKINIEHYVRQENNAWLLTVVTEPGDKLQLPNVSCELSLSEVYAKADFTEEE